MFQTLHLMFEQQYNELWAAGDLIAERIRALGLFAPGTYKEFNKLTSIKEEDGVPSAEAMIRLLVEGHETTELGSRGVFRRERHGDLNRSTLHPGSWRGGCQRSRPLSYFPSSHKYSTNDITAPSSPCTFGLVDSMT